MDSADNKNVNINLEKCESKEKNESKKTEDQDEEVIFDITKLKWNNSKFYLLI